MFAHWLCSKFSLGVSNETSGGLSKPRCAIVGSVLEDHGVPHDGDLLSKAVISNPQADLFSKRLVQILYYSEICYVYKHIFATHFYLLCNAITVFATPRAHVGM